MRKGFCWALMALTLCVSAARAADAPPSWTCLPDEAIAVARVPGAEAFFAALKKQTKLGAVLTRPDRVERIGTLLKEQGKEDLDELVKELGNYKLKIDDWQQLLAGEAGVALLLEPRGAEPPRYFFLLWNEPEADLSDRLYAALQQVVDEQRGEPDGPRREDFQVAGFDCMHLIVPSKDDEDETDEADQPKPASEKNKAAKIAEGDNKSKQQNAHVFLARFGARWLTAWTFNGTVPGLDDEQNRREIEGDTEACRKFFGEFLQAHREPRPSAITRLLDTPGLTAALPGGTPLVELLVDLRPLEKMLLTAAENTIPEHAESAAKSMKFLKTLGLDSLASLAYRVTLDGAELRGGAFLSLPAPRAGLFTLLDQSPLPAEPPAWVSSDVISYQHVGLDLGEFYKRLRDLAIAEVGDQARNAFETIDTQLKAMLQSDPVTLLSSLGRSHALIELAPQTETAVAKDADEIAIRADRTAVVWQVKDEALWGRVLQMASTLGGLPASEEQGFKGVRMKVSGFEGGIFVGRGSLVFASGAGVAESVLAMLRNPPAPNASLRGSALHRRANELLAPQLGLTYQLTDNNRANKASLQSIVKSLEVIRQSDQLDADTGLNGVNRAVIEAILALMPSEDELDGSVGVSVSQTHVDANGVTMQSVLELPPSEK
jgi:hypothetical protein